MYSLYYTSHSDLLKIYNNDFSSVTIYKEPFGDITPFPVFLKWADSRPSINTSAQNVFHSFLCISEDINTNNIFYTNYGGYSSILEGRPEDVYVWSFPIGVTPNSDGIYPVYVPTQYIVDFIKNIYNGLNIKTFHVSPVLPSNKISLIPK